MKAGGLKPRAELELDRFALDPYCRLYLPLWKLDGDSFMSKDAYGHLCTRYGGGTPPAAHWTPQGWSFDGVDDYVDAGNRASLNITGAITIEAWVQPTIVNSWSQNSVAIKFATEKYQWKLGLTDQAQLRFDVFKDQTTVISIYGGTLIADKWHYLVATVGAGKATIYLDGTYVIYASFPYSIQDTDPDLLIGYDPLNDRYFNGTIPLVLIYSRALTPQEILDHYIIGKEMFG